MEAPWPAPSGTPLIEPAPRRRRRWPLVVAVVAVLAVAGGAAALVASRDDSGGRTSSSADVALRAAVERLGAERFVTYRLEFGAGGGVGMEADAVYDTSSGILGMTIRGVGIPDGNQVVFDTRRNVMYLKMGALGLFPTDAEWVVFDLAALADAAGETLPGLADGGFGTPLDASRLLALASEVREVGVETLGGERLRHLRVTLDATDVADAPPGMLDDLPPEYRELVDSLPTSLTFDVWVTDDDELRRVSFAMPAPADMGGGPISVDMTITPTADAVPPTLPPPAETVDFLDMFESLGLDDMLDGMLDDAFSG